MCGTEDIDWKNILIKNHFNYNDRVPKTEDPIIGQVNRPGTVYLTSTCPSGDRSSPKRISGLGSPWKHPRDSELGL